MGGDSSHYLQTKRVGKAGWGAAEDSDEDDYGPISCETAFPHSANRYFDGAMVNSKTGHEIK